MVFQTECIYLCELNEKRKEVIPSKWIFLSHEEGGKNFFFFLTFLFIISSCRYTHTHTLVGQSCCNQIVEGEIPTCYSIMLISFMVGYVSFFPTCFCIFNPLLRPTSSLFSVFPPLWILFCSASVFSILRLQLYTGKYTCVKRQKVVFSTFCFRSLKKKTIFQTFSSLFEHLYSAKYPFLSKANIKYVADVDALHSWKWV